MKHGKLFVLSGPSGVGKGTVLEKLLLNFKDVKYSVSATTRKKRKGEVDGENYFFLTEEIFFQWVEDDKFIEWAKVHNHYYGTPKSYVNENLKSGKDIVLEIDIQGAKQIKENYPEAIFIFLVPPSLEELENRLNKRGSEDKKNKGIRLKNAQNEMREIANYDYQIINDDIEQTVDCLRAIIIAEKCKIK